MAVEVARAPLSASEGQNALGENVYAGFSLTREFQKSMQTCKIYRKLSVCQKIANDLSKCSKQDDLHFSDKIMHCSATLNPV
jgi:hypothetical protein